MARSALVIASRVAGVQPPVDSVYTRLDDLQGLERSTQQARGLGFFGPTGVAKHLRGRGYGRELLLASLADMREKGYERAIIPWTDALEFYRKSCGATIHERFATFLLDSAP